MSRSMLETLAILVLVVPSVWFIALDAWQDRKAKANAQRAETPGAVAPSQRTPSFAVTASWFGMRPAHMCAIIGAAIWLGRERIEEAGRAIPHGNVLVLASVFIAIGCALRVLHDSTRWLFDAAEALSDKRHWEAQGLTPAVEWAKAKQRRDVPTLPESELERRYPEMIRRVPAQSDVMVTRFNRDVYRDTEVPRE